jgi:hypothetical protein
VKKREKIIPWTMDTKMRIFLASSEKILVFAILDSKGDPRDLFKATF